jgi:hypothetical protein
VEGDVQGAAPAVGHPGRRRGASPERLVAVLEALRERGFPIEIEVVSAESSRLKVVLKLTEAEEGWLADFLASSNHAALQPERRNP